MIYRIGILYAIEWLVVADQATAYMWRCAEGMCFISSPPGTDRLAWTSAEAWCRNNGTQLVEITNEGVQNAMSSFLNNIRSTYNYDGISLFTYGIRKTLSWKWANGRDANYLSIGGPTDFSYTYGYLQLTTSGITLSASRPYETRQGYICENESQCTTATGFALNSRCYRSYSNEVLSWYDARTRCLDRGGDLASFDFISSNQGFSILNGTWLTQQTSYLIGLRREQWIWQGSQSDVKYSNWLNGHPRTLLTDASDCLCLEPSQWKWSECRCGDTKPFICMSEELSSSATTTTTTTTTATTTSPSKASSTPVSTDSTSKVANTTKSQHSSEITMPTNLSSSTSAIGATGADIAIGVGVGVGVGALVIAAIVVVALILIKKRFKRSNPDKEDKTKTLQQPPDIIALQTPNNSTESPYVRVVRLPEYDSPTTVDDSTHTDKPQTVYHKLEFITESSLADSSSGVANDTGSSRPSSPSRVTEADVEVDQVEMNVEQIVEVTRD